MSDIRSYFPFMRPLRETWPSYGQYKNDKQKPLSQTDAEFLPQAIFDLVRLVATGLAIVSDTAIELDAFWELVNRSFEGHDESKEGITAATQDILRAHSTAILWFAVLTEAIGRVNCLPNSKRTSEQLRIDFTRQLSYYNLMTPPEELLDLNEIQGMSPD